ncbi:hypothetical protein SSX86_014568 [Deinandra increscens subsp. villosa]|uniref:DUF569 domain-containing protein n=1 Tax=Deinandra increscens subsp. villosa TaxID=3103831 RepID=A0AAP0H0G4_9ASTR
MEYFQRAKAVRLRSHHHKYLLADEDGEHVSQDRQGTVKNARWTVEFDDDYDNVIRLKSCYGRYLTASGDPHLLGATGQKVIQSVPRRIDSSVNWEPIQEGPKARLKTRYGQYLRANGGVYPWRNSVTHDIPHRHHNWILWDVEVVEVNLDPRQRRSDPSVDEDEDEDLDLDFSDSTFHLTSASDLNFGSSLNEGRLIYYKLADDDGGVIDAEGSFLFKGTTVEDLTENLEEETELENITVCSRNPLNGRLYPLRLALPPNNTTMHVIVVPATSQAAKNF